LLPLSAFFHPAAASAAAAAAFVFEQLLTMHMPLNFKWNAFYQQKFYEMMSCQ